LQKTLATPIVGQKVKALIAAIQNEIVFASAVVSSS
jgi:hypothetical protein